LVHTAVMIIITNRKKDAKCLHCAIPEGGPFGLKCVVNKYFIYTIDRQFVAVTDSIVLYFKGGLTVSSVTIYIIYCK
jgi:hypothetical protein